MMLSNHATSSKASARCTSTRPPAATPICSTQRRRHSNTTSNKPVSVVVVAAAPVLVRGGSRGLASSRRTVGVALRQPQRAVVRARTSRTSAVVVQANLFTRLSRLIKATVDGFLGQFEDPERLLDRVVEEMTQDATRMRQAAAQAIASERQMQARAQSTQAAADQWLRRAELAVAAGQDELARQALARRKTIQQDADRLKQQADAQKSACDQLQGSVRMLESKISEARNKKETLKARAASAKSSMAINEMIGGLKSVGQNSFAAFSKMEEKVMALEAEAQSTAALVAPDSLEAQFAALEGGGVEDELRALKASVGSGNGQQARAALNSPRPRVDDVLVRTREADPAIDRELEELRRRARAL